MKSVQSKPAPRPLGSREFGTLMLLALFVAPMALHVVASLYL
jgi:hypothetical protein